MADGECLPGRRRSLLDAVRAARPKKRPPPPPPARAAAENGAPAAASPPRPPPRGRAAPRLAPRGRAAPRLTPRAFYAAAAARLAQVEERVLRFLGAVRRRVDLAGGGGGGAWRGPDPWALYPTQRAAFDFADGRDPAGARLRVFSREDAGGRRRFLATSYAELWRRYAALPPSARHYYEIIREGRPCHFYLDLEFATAANPGRDGPGAVDAVLAAARAALLELAGLELADEDLLELDSSTPEKFSRHVIARLPGGRAFASNADAGALAAAAAARVRAAAAAGDAAAAAAVIRRKGGGQALVIDEGVYTRNRAFRLHLSSKAGRAAALLPTGRFAGAALPTQQAFFRALVSNVEPGAELVRLAAAPGGAGAARAPGARHGIDNGGGGGGGATTSSFGALRPAPSPVAGLDAFVAAAAAAAGGGRAAVRSWVPLGAGALLLNLRGNRFCGNVGREHRSNGVFYVVDLQAGLWMQKCYDPECRDYRSPTTPLPPALALAAAAAAAAAAGEYGADEAPGGEEPAGGGGGAEAEEDDDDFVDGAVLAAVEAAERGHAARAAAAAVSRGAAVPLERLLNL
jgi:hypothetical protein